MWRVRSRADRTEVPGRTVPGRQVALQGRYLHDLGPRRICQLHRRQADGRRYFMMSAAQLERYRHAIASDTEGTRLAQVVKRLRAEGLEAGGSQALKSALRGYPRTIPDRTAPSQGLDLLAALASGTVAAYG